MMLRIVATLFLVWTFGFGWFVATTPGPVGDVATDAVIVPTGAAGRIQRGLEVLDKGWSERMLVSGVDPDVTPGEFAAQFNVSRRRMRCCVELGFAAEDTRGNAQEIAQWVIDNDIRTVRFVTSDWHMRRAASELDRRLPQHILVIQDAVPSPLRIRTSVVEYHKWAASEVVGLVDLLET